MKRVGPCKILAKYGNNAYKVDPPLDMNISSVFNVVDLIKFKGTSTKEDLESQVLCYYTSLEEVETLFNF